MNAQGTHCWQTVYQSVVRKHLLPRKIVFFLLLLLFCLILSGCGAPGVFVVNNNSDAGDANPGDGSCRINPLVSQCTLRAAIEEANALAGANIVNFNLPAGSLTIQPLTPLPAITEDLTLDAFTQPGFVSDPIVVLEGSLVGALTANGLETAIGVDVTLRGLRIQLFTGDGVHNRGNLEVWSSFLQTNGQHGLFSDGSTPGSVNVHLVSTHLTANARSGIIALNTNFDMSNDDVTDNSLGGIISTGGDIIMDNSRITGNTAHMGGGGMDLHVKTNAAFTEVTVSGNSTGDFGGGIRFAGDPGATMIFALGSITRNTADQGGGIYVESGVVHFNNAILADNRAASDGGGVYLKKDPAGTSALWVEGGTTIARNVADADGDGTGLGGGIYSQADVQMAESTVEANTGDGIYRGDGDIIILDSTVQTNTLNGVRGAGPTVMGVRIDRSDVSGNTLTGINLNTANLTMNTDTVMDNHHGGIFINGGQIYINDSTVADNSTGQDGGGIYGTDLIYASILRMAIWGNTADRQGGGLFLNGAAGSLMELSNITIHGNRAGVSGGGLYAESGRIELNNLTITQNVAGGAGGIDSPSPALYLSNSIVAENVGGNCGGTINSLGFNLATDGTCSLTGPGDLPGVGIVLGPMQDNGGPTFTREIFSPGPATDAANDATCEPTDQRGVPRPQGVHCDKGAYELKVAGGPVPVETAETPTPTATVTPPVISLTPTLTPRAPTFTLTLTRPLPVFTATATLTLPAATDTPTPTKPKPAANYKLEYLSGSGQTYAGGGMPLPMVFKIKNTTANTYVNQSLGLLNLSMAASASVGYQDAEFNNLNNYGGQGVEGFGGYYYVPTNYGPAYTLQITVTLSLNGVPVDSYLITENITSKATPTFTPTPTIGKRLK